MYHPYAPSTPQQSPHKGKSESSKLNQLLADFLSIGCTKGFKFFELYLRGREELLLRVYNETAKPKSMSRQPSSLELARSQSRSLLAVKTQKMLMWQSQDALPPASPCDRELERDPNKTAFLIAGYARYKCPLVWLRTNHSRFAKLQENSKQDDPLKLESVNNWKASDVRVWEIIAEILNTAVSPPPLNPFQVDHSFFDNLPLEESVVCTAAMLDFLQKVYIKDGAYSQLVMEDIEKLQARHFVELQELLDGKFSGPVSPRRSHAN